MTAQGEEETGAPMRKAVGLGARKKMNRERETPTKIRRKEPRLVGEEDG